MSTLADGWQQSRYRLETLPNAFRAYYASPLQQRVGFNKNRKCFVVDGTNKPVSGLTTKIERVFAHGVSPYRAASNQVAAMMQRTPELQDARKQQQTLLKTASGGRKCLAKGPKHGSLVDRQITKYTRLGFSAFVQKLKLPNIDPCTFAVIRALDDRGWEAVLSQAIIYSPYMRLATAVDVLAWDRKTHTMIVVELKALQRPENVLGIRGKMDMPLHDIDCSVMNMYHIQTALMAEILRREYNCEVSLAVQVQVTNGVVSFVPPPQWCTDRMDVIWETMSFCK